MFFNIVESDPTEIPPYDLGYIDKIKKHAHQENDTFPNSSDLNPYDLNDVDRLLRRKN